MVKPLRKLASTKTAGRFIYGVARLYSLTWRLTVENEEVLHTHLESGGRALVCLWHQQLLLTLRFFPRYRRYHPCVMISKSLDGDIASSIVEAGGVFVARGSSSRRGIGALKEMIESLRKGRMGVHVLDGPRGPAGEVKPGAVIMAQASGAALFPFAVLADSAWRLQSWDRFMIPKPFSRVMVKFLPPIFLPETMDDEALEHQRQALEYLMKPFMKNP